MTGSARRRWILASALGLLAAAAIALALAWRVGLDAYRGYFEQIVSRAAGRPFHLLGPIALKLAPLEIVAGPAVLDDPPGMKGPPLAAWRSASVRLRLLPLLQRRVVIGQVRLDGLQVHLQRSADGRSNWSGLGAPTAGAAGRSIAAVHLGSIEVRDGKIDLDDRQKGLRARLTHWQLDVGPSRLDGRLEIGRVRTSARVSSSVVPADLSLSVDLAGVTISSSPRAVTAPRWTIDVTDARQARAAEIARLAGALTLTGRPDHPALHGAITARVESVRGLAALLGIGVWHASDPEALGTLTLSGEWRLADDVLALDSLRMHLDATTLEGSIVRKPVDGRPLIEAYLHGDHIDLDRYVAGGGAQGRPFELPVAALRALRIAGSVTLDEARFGGVDLRHVRLAIPPPARTGALRP